MNRRDFLGSAVLAAIFAGAPVSAQATPKPETKTGKTRRKIPWQNWSGYQRCEPNARIAPKNIDELAGILKNTTGNIRPVGAGHSFSPLVPTNDTILSLRRFNGLKSHTATTATFGAGTKLGQLGKPLHDIGQALPNMPDIDEQSLAGAISTATHGTGKNLGAIHSYIRELELVTPEGEILRCSQETDADLFAAAKVSLGSLGVITEMTLDNVATQRMKRETWIQPLDEVLENFDQLAADNHSFEFYYIPFCDNAAVITINPTDEPISAPRKDTDNDSVMELKQLRDYLGWWPGLRRWLINRASSDVSVESYVDVGYKVFPSSREVRFNEMEYHMDSKHLIPTLRKVRKQIEDNIDDVFFPIEVRLVKGDDAWLSPFYGHESASIAVHRYYKEDPLPLFKAVEPIYQSIAGRPHWGKMHTLNEQHFAARYPKWQDFKRVRQALDPQGKMLNNHLKQVFGIA